MKALELLDDDVKKLSDHLIADEVPEDPNPSVIEKFFEFMDDLFDNVFWKSYFENKKKPNKNK